MDVGKGVSFYSVQNNVNRVLRRHHYNSRGKLHEHHNYRPTENTRIQPRIDDSALSTIRLLLLLLLKIVRHLVRCYITEIHCTLVLDSVLASFRCCILHSLINLVVASPSLKCAYYTGTIQVSQSTFLRWKCFYNSLILNHSNTNSQ